MRTPTPIRRLGFALVLPFALLAAACEREGGEPGWFSREDARTVTVTAGDAELDPSGRLSFEVTSDVYRRWTLAQRALGRSEIARYVASLGRRALTQEELDRAVARVQRDAKARNAIQGAGMTPLEYVYATVAIEQAMAVAKGNFTPRQGERGVPQQNVDIVGQHRDEILGGGVIGDTSVIVLPPESLPPEPLPPQPVPSEPLPTPQPLPPAPTPTPIPTPRPAPTPRDTARPPAPAPRDPAPTDPAPSPTPVPPADPEPTPAPPAPTWTTSPTR